MSFYHEYCDRPYQKKNKTMHSLQCWCNKNYRLQKFFSSQDIQQMVHFKQRNSIQTIDNFERHISCYPENIRCLPFSADIKHKIGFLHLQCTSRSGVKKSPLFTFLVFLDISFWQLFQMVPPLFVGGSTIISCSFL